MPTSSVLPIQEYPDDFFCWNPVLQPTADGADELGSDSGTSGEGTARVLPICDTDRKVVIDHATYKVLTPETTDTGLQGQIVYVLDGDDPTDESTHVAVTSLAPLHSTTGGIDANTQNSFTITRTANTIPAGASLHLYLDGSATELRSVMLTIRGRSREN